MKKLLLLLSAVLVSYSLPSLAAPVKVSSAAALGYGLDVKLDISAQATILGSVIADATISGGLNTPLGYVSKTSAGTPFNQHESTAGVSVILGGAGGVNLVNNIIGVVAPVVSSTSVLYGDAQFSQNPMAGTSTAQGQGGLLSTTLNIGNNGALFSFSGAANSLTSTSSVTVDEATGAFTTMASSTLVGATIKVLGQTINTALIPSGGITVDLLAGTPLAGLGVLSSNISAKVFFNEQSYLSDGVLASSCAGATFSCAVATNALRIKIENLTTAGIGLLGLANVTLDTDLSIIIGRSFASLKVISAVPEPETYAMFFAGLALVTAYTKRRKSN